MSKDPLFRPTTIEIGRPFQELGISYEEFVTRHTRGDWGNQLADVQKALDKLVRMPRFNNSLIVSIFLKDGSAIAVMSGWPRGQGHIETVITVLETLGHARI